nr:MAG TPA: hypothetical protein [Caudoviricetes sp.]
MPPQGNFTGSVPVFLKKHINRKCIKKTVQNP